MDLSLSYGVIVIAILIVITMAKTATVVPQQSAFVVENLGKYSRTLHAGFHILMPFVERVAYRHSLKESALEIPEQVCITRDNVQVGVDARALHAGARPAPRLLRHHQLRLRDRRSSRRRLCAARSARSNSTARSRRADVINANVVSELDKASAAWGVKVLRYEIKNITPPRDVLQAMEKQMRAEREKRAVVLTSEGERDAKINSAEGDKQRVIKRPRRTSSSRSTRPRVRPQAILAVATATAEGLRQVGIALSRSRRHRGDAAAHRRGIREAVRQAREGRQRRSWCPRTSPISPRS